MTSMSLYLPRPRSSDGLDSPTLQEHYDAALHNASMCLKFVFDKGRDMEGKGASVFSSHGAQGPSATYTSDWQALWTSCQNWYDARPLELQPLVDIASVEIGEPELGDEAIFPVELFTNVMGVVANITYHITVLLLLSKKPRLLKMAGRPNCFTSQNWHSRLVAGIATSNRFPDQWDPIIIATILYIARGMTHPTQQSAMIACLHDASAATGIDLEPETKQLRSRWRAFI